MATIQNLVGANKIKDEWQKINNNFAALNSAKVEKSGDTMTGPLSLLNGLKLLANALPTDEFGWLYADGAQHDIFFRDATTFRRMWHGGNNPASLATNGYQRFASGLILQWMKVTVQSGDIVTYPISFPNGSLPPLATAESITPVQVSVSGNSNTACFVIHENGSTPTNIVLIVVGW